MRERERQRGIEGGEREKERERERREGERGELHTVLRCFGSLVRIALTVL